VPGYGLKHQKVADFQPEKVGGGSAEFSPETG